MKAAVALLAACAVFAGCMDARAAAPYHDPSLPVATRVDDLLSRMTLDEKLGQMTQAERGTLVAQSDVATYNLGSILSGGGSSAASRARSRADRNHGPPVRMPLWRRTRSTIGP